MASIFDISGLGGALAISIITTLVVCYGLAIRWITKGKESSN